MNTLPDEILLDIVKYLPISTLLGLSTTNHLIHRIATDDCLWKTLLQRDKRMTSRPEGWKDLYRLIHQRDTCQIYKVRVFYAGIHQSTTLFRTLESLTLFFIETLASLCHNIFDEFPSDDYSPAFVNFIRLWGHLPDGFTSDLMLYKKQTMAYLTDYLSDVGPYRDYDHAKIKQGMMKIVFSRVKVNFDLV